MQISNNHISILSESAIQEICKPLFEFTEVTYFIYIRFYLDGTCISLPSNSRWHQHFWKNNFQSNTELRLITGVNLWDSEKTFSPLCNDAREFFNIDNRLDIVTYCHDYYEVFGFAGNTGNKKIINYYVNKIDELKKFTFYFKEKAHSLIRECEKTENKLLFNKIKKNNEMHASESNKMEKLNISQFKFPDFSISRREAETLVLTLRGRSATEIGSILNISPKTVESYIESIKCKFCCISRKELFDKAYDIGLIDLAKNISWIYKYR